MKAAFIGLGGMGAPMAGHLARQGLLHVVGNRSPGKAEALAAQWHVRAAGSMADYTDCDTVFLCVSADADVLANVHALADVLKPGSIVVDHSTVARETALAAARILAGRGIGFVDAPVSGGVEGARTGRLSIMCGGSEQHIEQARPALQCYGARIARLGDVGAGQAAKAVNQVMVAGINEAVCEALALGAKLGLEADTLLPTLASGAAGNWFLDKRGATMLRGQFEPGFKCALMLKDLRIVEATAQAAGILHPATTQARADYELLVREGFGEADTSALIALKLNSPG